MIAASDPLEYIPHGRQAIVRHPAYNKNAAGKSVTESSLLNKFKNVAITDSSFTKITDFDHSDEWWCVRQVCPNKKELSSLKEKRLFKNIPEEESKTNKLKTDFNASLRCEISNDSKKRNSDGNFSRLNLTPSNQNIFNDNLEDNLSTVTNDFKVDCCFEEELYVKGRTVIWSKGSISNQVHNNYSEPRVTVACYTCDTPVKHAIFCNFYSTVNDRSMCDALNALDGEFKTVIKIKDNFEKVSNETLPSICIIDGTSLRAFTKNGEDFVTSLQFQVKNVWSTKFGILLEKDVVPPFHVLPSRYSTLIKTHLNISHSKIHHRSNMFSSMKMNNTTGMDLFEGPSIDESDIELPTCFSLSHPLDEMAPMLIKLPHANTQYYKDGSYKIVFVSETPSICLIYSTRTKLHSLYLLRKATSEECNSVCGNFNKTTEILSPSGNLNLASSISLYQTGNSKFMKLNSHKSWSDSSIRSPYASRPPSSMGSANRSKLESPMAGMFNRLGLSPHTSLGQASNSSMLMINPQTQPPAQPLFPDLCFDHIWTESHGNTNDGNGSIAMAQKAFLHVDHTGQNFLCYLVSNYLMQQLHVVKLEQPYSTNSSKKHLIVGVFSTIPAKDAVVLPTLNMMAIIDLSGNIVLHSGLTAIGKLHIGGILTALITSPYNQPQVFDKSFPRRSSLLPSSHARDITLFDDSVLHQLSPVPNRYGINVADNTINSPGLVGLRDAVGNKFTLEYETGIFYRISLPELSTNSLVLNCINALKQILHKDIVMQVISKWYGIRNSPGTQDLCPKIEWSMFSSLMFSLLGYEHLILSDNKKNDNNSTEVVKKKLRTSSDGSLEDWEYILNSNHHSLIGNQIQAMLNLSKSSIKPKDVPQETSDTKFNINALLFPYLLQIFYAFHLLYEETKMNVLTTKDLEPLGKMLYDISLELGLDAFVSHYWKDFPRTCILTFSSNIVKLSETEMKKIIQPSYFTTEPPSIFKHLDQVLKKSDNITQYPYLNNVNNTCRDIIEILGLILNGTPGCVQIMISTREGMVNASSTPRAKDTKNQKELDQTAIYMLYKKGYTLQDVNNFPPAITMFLLNTIGRCKANPPVDWPHEVYSLIMREDLASQAKSPYTQIQSNNTEIGEITRLETVFTLNHPLSAEITTSKSGDVDKSTGLEQLDTKLLRLRFSVDHRITEVCNLLQSSVPVTISLTQRPDVSDHDFIEEQERHLYALCTRTMALPVGRGMVTLRSTPCNLTEPVQIPKLCSTGRAPPRNTTIELSHIEVPPHYSAWPLFHNGVAAGLKLVAMGSTNIDSAWIVYNKPKQGNADMPTEHAGFLMALGLNGHLKDMAFMNMYEYLVKCHEMTSVGLLLGIAATYRGTMDVSTTKLMSIHVEALLPPTSIELDIPQNIQVAALLGVGLLYQKTAHTHMTQVLLSEIGRPPGPEMENSSEREGYALAAGLGLGLVCLGSYKTAPQYLASTLRHYMLGGNKRPLTGSQKEKYKLPSFQIREGPNVNIDVTAPGATLALGMLYHKSNNMEVANWLAPPQTHYLLNHVRPDLLLLRVIARGLILWDSIEPTVEWVEELIPASIRPYCFVKPVDDNIDYEAMNQVYCNVISGACFSMALRFAGSANQDACDTILSVAKQFIRLSSKSVGELAGKSTIETCLNLVLLSAAMVMAGTGDLNIMRICRQQRARAGPGANSLTYGSQLAVHSALGLLFLGGGRYTLSTTPESIAALLCAFFPKFPTHSNDNRYHLQAFRHLYVLATEPRLLIPRDISSGTLCYVNLKVVTIDNKTIGMRAPCLLPEIEKIKEVRIDDSRYWPITFQKERNWDQLQLLLKYSNCLEVKQKAGCLSYVEDPQGFQSMLAQTLTTQKSNIWSVKPDSIFAFSNDQAVLNFTRHYLVNYALKHDSKVDPIAKFENCAKCSSPSNQQLFKSAKKICLCMDSIAEEKLFIQLLSIITYECVIHDTLQALPIWVTYLKICKNLSNSPSSYNIWQLKLLFSQIESHKKLCEKVEKSRDSGKPDLLSSEFTLSIFQKMEYTLDSWLGTIKPGIRAYMFKDDDRGEMHTTINKSDVDKVASFITYYDIPKNVVPKSGLAHMNILGLLVELDHYNLSPKSCQKIWEVAHSTMKPKKR